MKTRERKREREREREKGGWWLEDVMRLEMEDEGSKLDRNNHPDGELAFLDDEDTYQLLSSLSCALSSNLLRSLSLIACYRMEEMETSIMSYYWKNRL